MENGINSFTSETEKESFIKFLSNYYKNNKIHVFRNTVKEIKGFIFNTKREQPNIVPAILVESLMWQFISSAFWTTIPLLAGVLMTLATIVDVMLIGGSSKGYEGLPCVLIGIICLPGILLRNIVKKIKNKKEYEKDLEVAKNGEIIIEEIASECKNIANKSEKEIEEKIDNTIVDIRDGDDYYDPLTTDSLREMVELFFDMGSQICAIDDSYVRSKYYNVLYAICVFFDKTKTLSKSRKVKAYSFIIEEIKKLKEEINNYRNSLVVEKPKVLRKGA